VNEAEQFNFPFKEKQMRAQFSEVTTKLPNGLTLRLIHCRSEVNHRDGTGSVSDCRNEICASAWDEKKSKWRDRVRMIVAGTLRESMPEFLERSKKEISVHLPRFEGIDKDPVDIGVRTVYSFEGFARALQQDPS
jgi:hypothetical protein